MHYAITLQQNSKKDLLHPTADVSLRTMQTMFARCEFEQVITVIGRLDKKNYTRDTWFNIQLIHIDCLFQRQYNTLALDLLEDIAENDSIPGQARYARARLCFKENRHQDAERLFLQVVEQADSQSIRFRAQFDLAKLYYATNQLQKAPAILALSLIHI